MNSLNSILLEGNLTRDPVAYETPKGTKVCTFGIATNRFYKMDDEKQKEVSFFDVETWSKMADRCSENLEKGRGVRVVGRLKQDRWTDKEGKNKNRVKIVAEHVEFRPNFNGSEKPEETQQEDTAAAEDKEVAEISF